MRLGSRWVALAALVAFSCSSEPAAPGSPVQAAPAAAPAEPAPSPPPAEPMPAAAPTKPAEKRPPPAAETLPMLGSPFAQADLIGQLERASLLSFKPVGSTSTVFRTRLEPEGQAAFKAATRDRPLGPLAEIGAAAVARCLGLESVPPAVARSVPLALLRERLDPSAAAQWPEIAERLLVAKNGRVLGALIHWIPDLGDVGLNKAEGLARAREWLRVSGTLPDAERSLARSVSVMLGFDYIIGNFDRWSGSNTKGNALATSVYVRDHDLALPARLNESLHKRLASQMTLAERVSRGFYAYAQGLSRECIEREVALAYPEGASAQESALSPKVLEGIFDRRDGFLSHVDALRAQHGDEAILFFE